MYKFFLDNPGYIGIDTELLACFSALGKELTLNLNFFDNKVVGALGDNELAHKNFFFFLKS